MRVCCRALGCGDHVLYLNLTSVGWWGAAVYAGGDKS